VIANKQKQQQTYRRKGKKMSKRTRTVTNGEKNNTNSNKRSKQSDKQLSRNVDPEQIAEETDVRNLILNNKPSKKIKTTAIRTIDEETLKPGVIYLGHIPRGFFELQMKKFFSQFGKITRLRLARNARVSQKLFDLIV